MNRRMVLIKKPGASERIAAGAQRSECNPLLAHTSQRSQQRPRHGIAHVHSATHKDDVDTTHLIERAGGRELQSVARHDGRAVETDDRYFVGVLPGKTVRHAQWL